MYGHNRSITIIKKINTNNANLTLLRIREEILRILNILHGGK